MIIYSKHFLRRKNRKIPKPSCIPFVILALLLVMCFITLINPALNSIKVNLPKIDSDVIEIYHNKQYTTIYIREENKIVVNNINLKIDELCGYLFEQYNERQREEIEIFIQANNNILYSNIIDTIQILQKCGFSKTTLIGKDR